MKIFSNILIFLFIAGSSCAYGNKENVKRDQIYGLWELVDMQPEDSQLMNTYRSYYIFLPTGKVLDVIESLDDSLEYRMGVYQYDVLGGALVFKRKEKTSRHKIILENFVLTLSVPMGELVYKKIQ